MGDRLEIAPLQENVQKLEEKNKSLSEQGESLN